MALRLRGGGGGPLSENAALGVAPGGLIKQCILEDTNPATIWERDRTVCFNVQILNSDMFRQVTGKPPPSTPVSAKTYRDHGLPFYKIYGEQSTMHGDFDGIKSVKGLDKIKNENGKRGNEGDGAAKANKQAKGSSVGADEDDADEDEQPLENPIILLNSDGSAMGKFVPDEDEQPLENPTILLNPDGSAMGKFVPVSELMDELSRIEIAQ